MNRRGGGNPPHPPRLQQQQHAIGRLLQIFTPQTVLSFMRSFFSLFLQWYNWILSYVRSLWERWTGPVLTLDSGRQVRIGRPIAEGGFSIVFRATPITTNATTTTTTTAIYALKRIRCDDAEALQQCRKEASVHRSVGSNHPNIMPLLGMAVEDQLCYMLFPFMPHSLRDEVNRRIFDQQPHNQSSSSSISLSASRSSHSVVPPVRSPFPSTTNSSSSSHHHHELDVLPPWNELQTLQIFRGILEGVDALHRANFSHRDIKLENILFRGSNNLTTPVLMDFGSVGPLTSPPLTSRRPVLEAADIAASHTTLPYRPPELFEGGIRVGDTPIDYTKVDVWMLGCTLYATLYGASPFECDYHRSTGRIKIMDCTQLRVIGSIPYPPNPTAPSQWYSTDIQDLIGWILTQDREMRPTLMQVMARVDSLLQQGTTITTTNSSNMMMIDESDPIDVLMNRNVM